MHFHWQNLNDGLGNSPKSWPYHGRAWLYLDSHARRQIEFSWHLWSKSCGISVDTREGWTFHIALPPFSFWLGFEGFVRTGYKQKELSIRIHDWAVWWTFWKYWGEWSSRDGWRSGCFNFRDFLLGRPVYSDETLKTHEVKIPMPEGAYPATIRMYEARWARPRWFTKRMLLAQVDIPDGIPHEGKGENSWDIGEDATYGISREARTPEEAIAKVVETVLRDRRRYDGNLLAKYPKPEVRAARLKARRAKQKPEQAMGVIATR